ncbi:MFS transporter [Leuconostoc palmae]|uniref:MFS transporter n=1 Tax=Leuconostoc palmae TaxID=501487 RepID=UPI001C7E0D37|nr:MFS transporter [Leuconostoc palmae]
MNNITLEKQLTPRLVMSILAIGLLGFSDIMLETALNVSFPVLMKRFNISSNSVQWLTSGVILLTSIVVVLSPWLKKRFTNRSQFIVATIISLIGVLIDATSNNFNLILFGRLLQGIGGGVGMPLMYNVIFEQVPENRRGTMVGLGSLIISFAPALGPAFGGYLTQNYGWHMVFWVVLPIQLGSLILGWFTIKQVAEVTHEKLDWVGWLLLSSFFVSGIFMIERFSTHGLLNLLSLLLIVIMCISLVSYVIWGNKISHPLISPAIFRFKTFSLSVMASFITQVTNLTFNYTIPMVLQIVLVKNSQVAGLTLLPGALGYAIMAIISGRLYDRFSPKVPIYTGIVLMVFGTIMMAILPIGVFNMMVSFMFVQLGAGFWFGNNMTHAISHVPTQYHSAGNSIFSATNNYSAAVGIALAAGIMTICQNKGSYITGTQFATSLVFRLDIALIFIASLLSLSALRVVTQRH